VPEIGTPDPRGPLWTELDAMKVLVIGLLVLFVGFWLVQEPASLAAFAHDSAVWLWDMVTVVFRATIDFLSALFR
jgi:hypothetical protein